MTIKLLTSYEGDCIYKDLVIDNFREYCNRHGYELITKFDDWQHSERYYYWRKIEVIREYIDTTDYLLFLDMDCLIIDQTKRLEDAFDLDYDINITDNEGLQAGGMFLRNSEWTRNFLNDLWNMGNVRHPFWKGKDLGYTLCASANDNTCLAHMYEMNEDIRNHTRIHEEEKFMIKHCHFYKTVEKFIVHIPSASEDSKLEQLTNFSKHIIR
jgi:Protein of unknown function, DUF273